MDRFAADDKLVLTNLNKAFWLEEGYTKRDLDGRGYDRHNGGVSVGEKRK